MNNNTHITAAGAYSKNAQAAAIDPREIEARALMSTVTKMQDLQSRWDSIKAEEMDDVLRINRQIWMIFVDNAMAEENKDRPPQLRNNIANLGAYVFKRTMEVLADPKKEKLDVLIDINREIAAGLMSRPKAEDAAPQPAK